MLICEAIYYNLPRTRSDWGWRYIKKWNKAFSNVGILLKPTFLRNQIHSKQAHTPRYLMYLCYPDGDVGNVFLNNSTPINK